MFTNFSNCPIGGRGGTPAVRKRLVANLSWFPTDRCQFGRFDFILDAVSANHDIGAYINLLRRDGNITLVGVPEKPLSVSAFGLIMAAGVSPVLRLAVSPKPGKCSTFAAHNITADVEVTSIAGKAGLLRGRSQRPAGRPVCSPLLQRMPAQSPPVSECGSRVHRTREHRSPSRG